MTAVLSQKFANLLVPDAQADLSFYVPTLGRIAGKIVETSAAQAIEQFRGMYGGLWVGGKATLTATHLAFAPNAMNAALHVGDTSLVVPLADIRSVGLEFGFISGIIVVGTARGTFKLRCFRARRFAEQLRAAAGVG